jgi:hypothetical protein
MLTEKLRPASVGGIKSLASEIKKTTGLPHMAALNRAAQTAGYSNFTHARRAIGDAPHAPIYITVYWEDTKPYRTGRETLPVTLPVKLSSMLDDREFQWLRGLGGMRQVNDDHFVQDKLAPSQEAAQAMVCMAARSLQFLVYSKLRPLKFDHRHQWLRDLIETFPGRDHVTRWIDPASGSLLFISEPYEGRLNRLSTDRIEWCSKTGWQVFQVDWPGMYYPNSCSTMLVGPKSIGSRLERIATSFATAATPYDAENWQGESATSHETFLSPATKPTPQNIRRSKAKGTIIPIPSKTTIPYGSFSLNRRRPNGRLPLDVHVEIGSRLKVIIRGPNRTFVPSGRGDSVRCDLEDWMFAEHGGGAVDMVGGLDVYYGGLQAHHPFIAEGKSLSGRLLSLDRVRALLAEGYPDCAPLRSMIGKLETAAKAMKRELISYSL